MQSSHAWNQMLLALTRARRLFGGCALLALALAGPGCASNLKPGLARIDAAPRTELLTRVPHAQPMPLHGEVAGARARDTSDLYPILLTAGASEAPRNAAAKPTATRPSSAKSSSKPSSASEIDRLRARRQQLGEQGLIPWMFNKGGATSDAGAQTPQSNSNNEIQYTPNGERILTERGASTDRPAPIPPLPGTVPAQTPPRQVAAAPAMKPSSTGALVPPTPPGSSTATEASPTSSSVAAVRPTVVSASRARQQAASQWAVEKPKADRANAPESKVASAEPTPVQPAPVAAPVPEPTLVEQPVATRRKPTPKIPATMRSRPAAESPAPERLAADDKIAPTPIASVPAPVTPITPAPIASAPTAEAPQRTTPAEHDNRLAVNDRMVGARFPTQLPRPTLSQPLNSAAKSWKSELSEEAHAHLTASQREVEAEELAVAPLPGKTDRSAVADDDPPPAPPKVSAPVMARVEAAPPEIKASPRETVRIRSGLEPQPQRQSVEPQPSRQAVAPPKADAPAPRSAQETSAEYLRFADRHATRPNGTPKAGRPSEFVNSLAASRQAEMAAAVQPLPVAANEAATPALEEPAAPRVASNAQPRRELVPEPVTSPKDVLAPTAPIPSPAEGAPALSVERMAAAAPTVDKNSAYVRAISEWTVESYAGVRNYRMELFQIVAAPGPLAHRDGVTFRFRKAPLAIHVGWNADPLQGRQWIYTEGSHEDKWFVLEPVASGRMKVLVEQDALPLGGGTRPIDEWGLGGVIARFQKHLAQAGEGEGRCVYEGVVRRQEIDVTMHEVVYYPPGNGCSVHYYFATSNLLPRLVEAKLDGDVRSAEIFKKLELNVTDLDRPASFDANDLFRN